MEKIVHLIWTLEAGGSENMLVDIANEQTRYADVTIILINRKFNTDLIKRIDSKVHFYALNRSAGNKRSMWFLFRLWNLLLKIQPQVIHCHNHSIIRLLPLFRKRTVLTIHCLNVSPVHLTKYRKVYAISGAVADDIRQRTGIVSPVVLNGINFKDISPRHHYEAGSIKLVQVGRLVHELKGQDLLLQALKKIIDQHHHVTLDFVGNGPSLSYLQELTASLGLNNHVTFLGEKNRNWIYHHLSAYNILIQPSRFEGFGLTVLEGIAAGLPVIASDQAGPSEILQNMPGGYLFRSGDADDLAVTIQQVITQLQEGTMQQVCVTSREIADAKYSVRRTAFEYMEQYGQL